MGGSTNSASGSRYTSTYNTANAQQSRAQPDSFAALLSAVVQDATNSGILQMPNSVSAGPISQPTASNARHKRAVSLAQMVEQQQKQLHGNIVLNHNQHRISSQRSPYQQSLATSPSLLPLSSVLQPQRTERYAAKRNIASTTILLAEHGTTERDQLQVSIGNDLWFKHHAAWIGRCLCSRSR